MGSGHANYLEPLKTAITSLFLDPISIFSAARGEFFITVNGESEKILYPRADMAYHSQMFIEESFRSKFAKDRRRWLQWLFEAKRRYGLEY